MVQKVSNELNTRLVSSHVTVVHPVLGGLYIIKYGNAKSVSSSNSSATSYVRSSQHTTTTTSNAHT